MTRNVKVMGHCDVELLDVGNGPVIGAGVVYRSHVTCNDKVRKLVGCSSFVRYRISAALENGAEYDFTSDSVIGLRDKCIDNGFHFDLNTVKV